MFFDSILNEILDIWKKSRTISSVFGLISVGCLVDYLMRVMSGNFLSYINAVFLCIVFLPLFLIPQSAENDLIIYIKEKRRGNIHLQLERVSMNGASLGKLLLFIIVSGGILINTKYIDPSAQIGFLKWLCIAELVWTVIIYIISGIIMIREARK